MCIKNQLSAVTFCRLCSTSKKSRCLPCMSLRKYRQLLQSPISPIEFTARMQSSTSFRRRFGELHHPSGIPVILTIFSYAPGFVHFCRNQDKTSFCTKLCFVHDHCPQPASFLRCFKTSKKMAAFYSHLQMGNVKTCSMSSFLSAPYKKGIHSQCIYPQVSLSRNALFCKPTKRFYYSWH